MIIIIIPLQLVIYSDWEIFSLTNWSRVDNALMSFDLQLSSADDKVSTESSHFTAGWRCTMLANSDVWRPDARLLTPLTSRILQSNAEPDHVSSLALHGGSHSKQNKQIEANIDNQCRTKMSWPGQPNKDNKTDGGQWTTRPRPDGSRGEADIGENPGETDCPHSSPLLQVRTLDCLQGSSGVRGVAIITKDGIPLQTTLDNSTTVQVTLRSRN